MATAVSVEPIRVAPAVHRHFAMHKNTWALYAFLGALAGCSSGSDSTSVPDSGNPETGSNAVADTGPDSTSVPDSGNPETGSNAVADTGPDSTGADAGLVCAHYESVAYARPGCGANAPAPYCQGPTDACLMFFCDCDGRTHAGGCGFSDRPYLYAGYCGDAGEAGSD